VSQILIGRGEQQVHLLAKYGNRHGLVAGATGTGKTVSLLVLAEGFSRLGVPVFMADVKGDVAGLAMAGVTNEKIEQRVAQIGIEGYTNEATPVVFWDILGKTGHPVRMTVSEIGPSLLSRILELNDIQSGTLEVAFKLDSCCSTQTTSGHSSRSSQRIARRSRRSTVSSARSPSPPSSAPSCRSSAKAESPCSVSRVSSSGTSCAPTSRGAAS